MVYIKSTSTNNYYQKFELFTKIILFINIFGVMRVVTLLNLFSQSPACLPIPPCRHPLYLLFLLFKVSTTYLHRPVVLN